ncbi:hypothetical protein SNEBB_004503 [Seison nebaliae]|nr:hypothetical protein SNEBB_004503 [Seison nebaliae]
MIWKLTITTNLSFSLLRCLMSNCEKVYLTNKMNEGDESTPRNLSSFEKTEHPLDRHFTGLSQTVNHRKNDVLRERENMISLRNELENDIKKKLENLENGERLKKIEKNFNSDELEDIRADAANKVTNFGKSDKIFCLDSNVEENEKKNGLYRPLGYISKTSIPTKVTIKPDLMNCWRDEFQSGQLLYPYQTSIFDKALYKIDVPKDY